MGHQLPQSPVHKRRLKRPLGHPDKQKKSVSPESTSPIIQSKTIVGEKREAENANSDEDDTPLFQNRFFNRQRRKRVCIEDELMDELTNDLSIAQATTIDSTPEKVKMPVAAVNFSTQSNVKMINLPISETEPISKESEPILQKLSDYMTMICNEQTEIRNSQSTINPIFPEADTNVIPLSVLRQFTILVVKTVQAKCFRNADQHQFGQILSRMEYAIGCIVDLDILEEYAKETDEAQKMSKTIAWLEKLSYGIEISVLVVDLLAVCRVNKQDVPKGLITTCLRLVKSQLESLIYPLIDLTSLEDDPTSLNNDLRRFLNSVEASPPARRNLSGILPLITRFLRRSFVLLQQDEIDDHGILIVGYISMGPFFHDYTESNTSCLIRNSADSTVNPFEQMKFSALDMLTTLFGNYPQHRRWILDEILTGMGNLTTMDRSVKRYRLSDGRSLHVMSALWIQLVQSCCAPTTIVADRGWLRKWELKQQRFQKDNETKQLAGLEEKLVQKAAEVWKTGIEAAAQTATYFLDFLMAKCRSRKKDTYSVAEYRMIMESTVEDILVVLSDPSWPAAELILRTFTKLLVAVIESGTSDIYLKSLAIEWLGTIACTIKMGCNRLSGEKGQFTPEWVYKLNEQLPTEITQDTALNSLEFLAQCQMKLYNHVENSNVDPSLTKFYLASWGYTDTMICSFDFPELNREDIGLLSELLASRQPLYNSFQFLISHIMACLDNDSVSYRVKALRSMGRIATEVPTVLDEPRIRNPIIKRIHDASPSVRDAALEVMARYLGRQETLSLPIYNIVSERIMDTAMTVRKRLVKLLRELHAKCDDRAIKIDISAKLIQRIGDNEISISEAALKATQEILFHPFREIDNDGNDAFGSSYQHFPKERKRQITELTLLITGATTRDISSLTQSSALIQILQKTVAGCDSRTMVWYKMVFQWIVDALFEHMLLLDEQGNTEGFLCCLTTVYAFTKTSPDILRETHISMLEPYLSITEEDDWRIARYVLMIYRDVLPRRRYHDPDFVAQVEQALQQLLSRCPLDMIQSTVSCLCAIIDNISKRYNLLIKMLGACLGKLQQDRAQMSNGKPPARSITAIRKMLLISSLLCRYFDFDEKRKTEPVKLRALDIVHKQSITKLAFDLILYFASSLDETTPFNQIMATALQSLGHLYAAHPTFVIEKTSTELMDKLFESGSEPMKVQLLRVFVEFLAAEENRIEKQEEVAGQSLHTKLIDVETLMGNTEEFSELGVNGSLMQRYFRRILKCALEKTPDIRYAAFEVVSVVVNQGLAHPVLVKMNDLIISCVDNNSFGILLKCMPAVVAAETSSDITLRNKAYYLHRFAHDKYGPLLYSNFGEHISTAYEYQKLMADDKIEGYGKRGSDAKVDSLFALPFSVFRQKKKIKLDFLCALVKPFDFDMKVTKEEEVNVEFLKFLAESIITLDFSMLEEILCVLNGMDRILMTVGADLLSSIQIFRKKGLLSKPNDMNEFGRVPSGHNNVSMDPAYAMTAKTAIAMSILLYVRELLMDVYSISNDEIQSYSSTDQLKSRTISRDNETVRLVDWTELEYFKIDRLNHASAADGCRKFEDMMMESAGMDSRKSRKYKELT
ncbi:hypothetical protein PHYBLDRAFT_172796 [Phycomyces blakesleeanus NRRL 1555(-)]|uniref:Sister chromatid cohesion protein n=1 Tax=Phycomyces blakesleeanus (strain ATCC 8743b / DSM 1359 / FGSC 10004 / NBRC 33097 / NRRL 1555) TaxID=763407 RepID=A0A163D5U6_PHYB8|nr:hypothetical protein PHYBLDRAFT_172796 [Phycomyces blakesleeanus NRRL 1555(-)]OAD68960.1 hypothetical protein PHYBLDRAFT_172796 [Phycomyces blakesleeanus NRRL 1555(-)]|eukprot:XP_018287000.1 hypothetical protein PHYBLDRAFT_172796 [Phycomyces blakesleeanus NRRL 1555(-)]